MMLITPAGDFYKGFGFFKGLPICNENRFLFQVVAHFCLPLQKSTDAFFPIPLC